MSQADSTTALYRHFDASGVLLYVGISISALQRFKQHLRSAWANEIAYMRVERHPSRKAALLAEAAAIKAEKPVHNKMHKSKPTTGEIWHDAFSAAGCFDKPSKTCPGDGHACFGICPERGICMRED